MRVEIAAGSPLWLAAALREFPEPEFAGDAPGPERGRIRICFDRPSVPEPPVSAFRAGSHGLSFHLAPETLWLRTAAGSLAHVELSARRVTLSLAPHAEPGARDVAALLGIALPYLYRELGLYPVHAAAVLAGDVPILLAGPSGSGKSTTAALLAAAGMAWLADDLVLLETGETGLTLRGVARRPRLDAGSLARLAAPESNASATRPLAMNAVESTPVSPTSPLLLFPRLHRAEECRIIPIGRPAALDELIRCSLLMGERGPAAAHLEALAALARRARVFRLFLGERLDDLPARITSRLQDFREEV